MRGISRQSNSRENSSTSSRGDKTQSHKAEDRNKQSKLLLSAVLIFIITDLIAIIYIYNFSKTVDEVAAFYLFLSEASQNYIEALTISVFAGTIISHFKKIKTILLDILIVLFIILLLTISCGLKIKAESIKKPIGVTVDPKPIEADGKDGLKKSVYIFEDDPFMGYLEEYCGVPYNSIVESDIPVMISNIVLANIPIKTKKNDETIPEIYIHNINLAEAQYNTYLFQFKRDRFKSDSTSKKIKEHRLIDLSDAINYRIEANVNYISLENQRLISVYFKDQGDEYVSEFNHENSAKCYEQASIWIMSAVWSAAASGNCEKFNLLLSDFEKIYIEMKKLTTIGEGRIKKIENCYLAYKIVVEEVVKK